MQIGQSADLRRHQRAADRKHLAHPVAAALARAPGEELRLDIGGGLAGERRVAGADAFTDGAVTLSAFGGVERRYAGQGGRIRGQGGVIGRYLGAVHHAQPADDGTHFGMFAPAVRVIVELAVEIAGVEPREARDEAAVAFTLEAVAGRAGVSRAAVAAAKGNDLAAFGKGGIAAALSAATGEDGCEQQDGHGLAHAIGTLGRAGCSTIGGAKVEMGVRIALMAALLLTGCENVGVAPNQADASAIARGKRAAERLGCGACHAIPGVWPAGTTGPPLAGFATRGMIAGRYPNRPDTLARFLIDPSGTAMPHQPMSRQDAEDIAAMLHAR